MKNTLSKTIGAAALFVMSPALSVAESGFSSTASANIYYRLTPVAASQLNIDFEHVKKIVNPTERQEIGFHVKEDGEIDLSIFEDGNFSALRPDIVEAL